MRIGQLTFPNHFIQGPLAGVSAAPFRALIHRFSSPAYVYTEMMSAKTIINGTPDIKRRYLFKDHDEGKVCYQLSGADAVELSEAAKIVVDHGADLIDLNCGCPVNKIRKKGAGSKLLDHPSHLFTLIAAMRKSVSIPVTVKIRIPNLANENHNRDIARAIVEAGADAVVVHGRTAFEHYEVPCRYDAIQFFVNEVTIPVIGNGDIATEASYQEMRAMGCQGVMIARASVGRPWLIADLQNGKSNVLELSQIGAILIEHVTRLATLLGSEKKAVFEARGFAKYYARHKADHHGFCERLNQCDDLETFIRLCQPFFI